MGKFEDFLKKVNEQNNQTENNTTANKTPAQNGTGSKFDSFLAKVNGDAELGYNDSFRFLGNSYIVDNRTGQSVVAPKADIRSWDRKVKDAESVRDTGHETFITDIGKNINGAVGSWGASQLSTGATLALGFEALKNKNNYYEPDKGTPLWKMLQASHANTQKASGLMEDSKEGRGKIGQIAMDVSSQAVMNGIDAALKSIPFVGQVLGTASFMSRSFGSKAQEMRDQGKSVGTQVVAGVVSAAIEQATESMWGYGGVRDYSGKYLPDSGLLGRLTSKTEAAIAEKLSPVVAKLVMSFGTEAVEEMAADLINPLVTGAVENWFGDTKLLQDFEKEELQSITDILYDGLIGGLSGIGGGMVESVGLSNEIKNEYGGDKSAYVTAIRDQQERTRDLKGDARAIHRGSLADILDTVLNKRTGKTASELASEVAGTYVSQKNAYKMLGKQSEDYVKICRDTAKRFADTSFANEVMNKKFLENAAFRYLVNGDFASELNSVDDARQQIQTLAKYVMEEFANDKIANAKGKKGKAQAAFYNSILAKLFDNGTATTTSSLDDVDRITKARTYQYGEEDLADNVDNAEQEEEIARPVPQKPRTESKSQQEVNAMSPQERAKWMLDSGSDTIRLEGSQNSKTYSAQAKALFDTISEEAKNRGLKAEVVYNEQSKQWEAKLTQDESAQGTKQQTPENNAGKAKPPQARNTASRDLFNQKLEEISKEESKWQRDVADEEQLAQKYDNASYDELSDEDKKWKALRGMEAIEKRPGEIAKNNLALRNSLRYILSERAQNKLESAIKSNSNIVEISNYNSTQNNIDYRTALEFQLLEEESEKRGYSVEPFWDDKTNSWKAELSKRAEEQAKESKPVLTPNDKRKINRLFQGKQNSVKIASDVHGNALLEAIRQKAQEVGREVVVADGKARLAEITEGATNKQASAQTSPVELTSVQKALITALEWGADSSADEIAWFEEQKAEFERLTGVPLDGTYEENVETVKENWGVLEDALNNLQAQIGENNGGQSSVQNKAEVSKTDTGTQNSEGRTSDERVGGAVAEHDRITREIKERGWFTAEGEDYSLTDINGNTVGTLIQDEERLSALNDFASKVAGRLFGDGKVRYVFIEGKIREGLSNKLGDGFTYHIEDGNGDTIIICGAEESTIIHETMHAAQSYAFDKYGQKRFGDFVAKTIPNNIAAIGDKGVLNAERYKKAADWLKNKGYSHMSTLEDIIEIQAFMAEHDEFFTDDEVEAMLSVLTDRDWQRKTLGEETDVFDSVAEASRASKETQVKRTGNKQAEYNRVKEAFNSATSAVDFLTRCGFAESEAVSVVNSVDSVDELVAATGLDGSQVEEIVKDFNGSEKGFTWWETNQDKRQRLAEQHKKIRGVFKKLGLETNRSTDSRVRAKLSKPDSRSTHKATMYFAYNGQKRSDVTADTTFDAILNGERTATTREAKWKGHKQWQDTKVGDIISFSENKDGTGRSVIVRVDGKYTVKSRIDKDTVRVADDNGNTFKLNRSQWSKKEGWSENSKWFSEMSPGDVWVTYQRVSDGDFHHSLDDIIQNATLGSLSGFSEDDLQYGLNYLLKQAGISRKSKDLLSDITDFALGNFEADFTGRENFRTGQYSDSFSGVDAGYSFGDTDARYVNAHVELDNGQKSRASKRLLVDAYTEGSPDGFSVSNQAFALLNLIDELDKRDIEINHWISSYSNQEAEALPEAEEYVVEFSDNDFARGGVFSDLNEDYVNDVISSLREGQEVGFPTENATNLRSSLMSGFSPSAEFSVSDMTVEQRKRLLELAFPNEEFSISPINKNEITDNRDSELKEYERGERRWDKRHLRNGVDANEQQTAFGYLRADPTPVDLAGIKNQQGQQVSAAGWVDVGKDGKPNVSVKAKQSALDKIKQGKVAEKKIKSIKQRIAHIDRAVSNIKSILEARKNRLVDYTSNQLDAAVKAQEYLYDMLEDADDLGRYGYASSSEEGQAMLDKVNYEKGVLKLTLRSIIDTDASRLYDDDFNSALLSQLDSFAEKTKKLYRAISKQQKVVQESRYKETQNKSTGISWIDTVSSNVLRNMLANEDDVFVLTPAEHEYIESRLAKEDRSDNQRNISSLAGPDAGVSTGYSERIEDSIEESPRAFGRERLNTGEVEESNYGKEGYLSFDGDYYETFGQNGKPVITTSYIDEAPSSYGAKYNLRNTHMKLGQSASDRQAQQREEQNEAYAEAERKAMSDEELFERRYEDKYKTPTVQDTEREMKQPKASKKMSAKEANEIANLSFGEKGRVRATRVVERFPTNFKMFGKALSEKQASVLNDSLGKMRKALIDVNDGYGTVKDVSDLYRTWRDNKMLADYWNEDVQDRFDKILEDAESRGWEFNPQEQHEFAQAYEEAGNAMIARINNINKDADRMSKLKADAIANKRGWKSDGLLAKAAQKWLRMQATTDTALKFFGGFKGSGAFYDLSKDIKDSVAKRMVTYVDAYSYFDALKKMGGFKEFSENKKLYKLNASVDYLDDQNPLAGHEFTLQQIVTIKRLFETLNKTFEHSKPGIYDRIKGFVVRDAKGKSVTIELKGKGDSDTHNVMVNTQGLVDAERACNDILKQEGAVFEVARAYDKACNEMFKKLGKQVSDVRKALTGNALSLIGENYTPVLWANEDGTPADFNFNDDDRIKPPSFLYNRTAKQGYLVVSDISYIVDKYIEKAADYVGTAQIKDTLARMNDGTSLLDNGKGLNSALAENFGKEAGSWFDEYVKDLTEYGENDSIWAALRRNMQKGALIGSPSVMMKQTSSYWSAMGLLSPEALTMAYRWKVGVKAADNSEFNPLLKYRSISDKFDPTLSEIIQDVSRYGKASNSRVFQLFVNGISAQDYKTVDNLYTATMIDTYLRNQNKDAKYFTSGEFQSDIDSKFTEVMMRSQPMFDTELRAEYARTDNELVKMTSMFRTQQTQNLNLIATAIGEYNASKGTGNQAEKAEVLRQTVAGQASAALSLALLSVAADFILHGLKKYRGDGDDEDEKPGDGKIELGRILGRIGLNAVEAGAGTAWFGDSVAKWLIDQMSGGETNEFYSFNMGPLSTMKSVIDNLEYAAKSPTPSNIKNVATNIAQLLGWPINNAYRYVNSAVMYAHTLTGNNDQKYDDMLKMWGGAAKVADKNIKGRNLLVDSGMSKKEANAFVRLVDEDGNGLNKDDLTNWYVDHPEDGDKISVLWDSMGWKQTFAKAKKSLDKKVVYNSNPIYSEMDEDDSESVSKTELMNYYIDHPEIRDDLEKMYTDLGFKDFKSAVKSADKKIKFRSNPLYAEMDEDENESVSKTELTEYAIEHPEMYDTLAPLYKELGFKGTFRSAIRSAESTKIKEAAEDAFYDGDYNALFESVSKMKNGKTWLTNMVKDEYPEYENIENPLLHYLTESGLSTKQIDTAVESFGGKKLIPQYKKLRESGLSPKQSVERLDLFDANDNGSITQTELADYYKAHPEEEAIIAEFWAACGWSKTWAQYKKSKKLK